MATSRISYLKQYRDVWDIHCTSNRRIRVGLRIDKDVVFVHLKLILHVKCTATIPLTLAEFGIIPGDAIANATSTTSWVIPNGRRQRQIVYNDAHKSLKIMLKRYGDEEWKVHSEIEITKEEFILLYSCTEEVHRGVTNPALDNGASTIVTAHSKPPSAPEQLYPISYDTQ
jgi:hypothetical protein